MTVTTFTPPALVAIAMLIGAGIAQVAEAEDAAALTWLAQAEAGDRQAADDDEALKLAALEALMAAPSERALPVLRKVLDGDSSDRVKSRALFVLSQVRHPDAQTLLMDVARRGSTKLRHEAIRAIGIGGSPAALAQLGDVYRDGDDGVREAIRNAYMIAGNADPLLEIARNASSDAEFDAAVRKLGAMGATDALKTLVDHRGNTSSLMQAYAIAGDLDSLLSLARSEGDNDRRVQAIRSIGIVGGDRAGAALLEIYRSTTDESVREAVLQGLLISGHDKGVLELFRASRDNDEKRRLMRTLVHMGSDLALDVIDDALEDE